jgi:pyruvate dehydrogenase E2 component (dihydrolipoamide acetyltransferase)
MPSLGADMEAGTILHWRVKPGDRVARGDIVVDVETEKAEMEVEIFEAGVVERILVAEGEKVAVGAPLAVIGTGAPAAAAAPPVAAAPAPAPPPPAPPVAAAKPEPLAPPRPAAPSAPPEPAPPRAAPGERVHATPLARRIAAELGVELRGLRGSGVDGAITGDDVRAAAAQRAPAPPAEKPAVAAPAPKEAGRQRVVAALMERSKREIPHYYLETAIDLSPALAWLEGANRERPVAERILPAALLLRAVVLAAAEVPEVNGHFVEGAFRPSAAVHLGVAVAVRGGGLLAPAILDAHAKRLPELMASLRDVVTRTRGGKLRASEMANATLTVTSLGDNGVDAVQAVIYPPQVAIVGFGTPALRPWVDREGGLCARTVVHATLAADHRVSNGHRGAAFLRAVARALANPESLA